MIRTPFTRSLSSLCAQSRFSSASAQTQRLASDLEASEQRQRLLGEQHRDELEVHALLLAEQQTAHERAAREWKAQLDAAHTTLG